MNLHWLFAYLFMANGALYLIGLLAGGGYRARVPRRSDARETLAMMRYYAGVVPAKLLRRPWPHPVIRAGSPDPYYVSIDLATARHPQTMLATHWNGSPLPVDHGAPLRLVAPMKLGLKNIKAITTIAYSREQPPDYWAERGYSKCDGL